MAKTTQRAATSGSLVSLAWRNLWANRRRTLITLSSIVFGVFFAILMTALQDRNWADMIDLAAKMGGGHVTLQHPEYQDAPTLRHSVQEVSELAAAVEGAVPIDAVRPRIVGNLMLSTAHESFGAGFIAYDPALETSETLAILNGVAEDEGLRPDDRQGILLGTKLAYNLDAEVGDKVVYTVTDRNGEITSALCRVRGLVTTGAPSVDASLVLLPIEPLREVIGYGPDEANQVAIFLSDQRSTERAVSALVSALRDDVAVLGWNKAQPELAGFIAAKVGGAWVVEGLIGILVAAGIFNTLFVSVMERMREFGIMLAIGWSPGRLFRLVMLESLWLGVVGLILAGLVTVGPYLYLEKTGIDISKMLTDESMEIAGVAMAPVLKVGIFPMSLVIILGAAMFAVLASGIYPAWRAGRINPVETIRLV